MAVDSEAKRWSMLAFANGPVRTHVFNPDTSGLVSVEKITVLQHYGGIAWDAVAIVSVTTRITIIGRPANKVTIMGKPAANSIIVGAPSNKITIVGAI